MSARFFEKSIREDVCQTSKRHTRANNPNQKTFDASLPEKYLIKLKSLRDYLPPQESRMSSGVRTGRSMRSRIRRKAESRLGRRMRVRGFGVRFGSSTRRAVRFAFASREDNDRPVHADELSASLLPRQRETVRGTVERQPLRQRKIRDALSHVADVLQIETRSDSIPSRDVVRTILVYAKLHDFNTRKRTEVDRERPRNKFGNKAAQGVPKLFVR